MRRKRGNLWGRSPQRQKSPERTRENVVLFGTQSFRTKGNGDRSRAGASHIQPRPSSPRLQWQVPGGQDLGAAGLVLPPRRPSGLAAGHRAEGPVAMASECFGSQSSNTLGVFT